MRRCAGPARRSGRETISTVRLAGCARLAVLIAATFEICKTSRRRVQSSKVRRKTRALCVVGAGRTACAVLLAPRAGATPVRTLPTFYAVVFVELRKATRRDISRDAAKAKNALASSRLISTAKPALLRSGFHSGLFLPIVPNTTDWPASPSNPTDWPS